MHGSKASKDVNAATHKLEQIVSYVERDLEVIISLVDAERTLEQLMDDRGIISSRIRELQQNIDPQLDAEAPEALDLANLQEELEMRNAQISDLQQKVCANDMDSLMQTVAESFQTLPEARAVFKHLLKSICEMRREHAHMIEELRSSLHAIEEKCSEATKAMRQMKTEHERAISEYEEKISLALTPEQMERLKQQEEQEKKIESLMIELENYKQMRDSGSSGNSKKAKKHGMKVGCSFVILPTFFYLL